LEQKLLTLNPDSFCRAINRVNFEMVVIDFLRHKITLSIYPHNMYSPECLRWNNQLPLPITKEQSIKRYEEMKDIEKLENFGINPARIVVTENAAVVDYYFTAEATYTRGEKKELKEFHGQNVEFFVKEGGKWLLLGDMTTIEEAENNNKDDE